jgi:hypothetical protein
MPLTSGGTKARAQAWLREGTVQGKGRPRCSQRVGGVVVVGLAWAVARRRCRCSRRRPLRSGSSEVTNGASLVRLLASPSILSSDAPTRRGARSSPTPPLSPTLPFLSPIGGAVTGKGQNPNAGWWDAVATLGLSIESWSRRCRGKEGRGGAPIGGHGAAADVEPHQWRPGAFGVTERGQRGLFPRADSPGPVVLARKPSACGPTHPQPSHPARGTLGGAARWSWWLRGEKGMKKIGGKGD